VFGVEDWATALSLVPNRDLGPGKDLIFGSTHPRSSLADSGDYNEVLVQKLARFLSYYSELSGSNTCIARILELPNPKRIIKKLKNKFN